MRKSFFVIFCCLLACIAGCAEQHNPGQGSNVAIMPETENITTDAGVDDPAEEMSYIFGSYEQDNNADNGKEDIEWIILEKTDDAMLIISKYALDHQKYNIKLEDTTWDRCTLRTWLNDTFVNTAFTESQQERILVTTVIAEDNPYFGTDGGKNTEDRVFLLSVAEALSYFADDEERKCQSTAYAQHMGAIVSQQKNESGNCWWALRTPGDQWQSHIAYVAPHGEVYDGEGYEYGFNVDSKIIAIRPAMWIKTE